MFHTKALFRTEQGFYFFRLPCVRRAVSRDTMTFLLQFAYSLEDNYEDDNFVDMKLNRAAKGYFRTGYALFAENEELDEWEYTNGFGDTLSLILGKSYGIVLYDSEQYR